VVQPTAKETANRRLPRARAWIAGAALAAMLGLSATATAAQADASAPRSPQGGPVKQLAQAYAGTAKFHSVSAALQAGYVPTGPCVEVPGQGGLGIVYGNFGLLADGEVDPRTPEALFYEPRANGKLRLVGVEYILLDADGDPATVEDRPTLFGQPFDGPTAEPQAGLPLHYDLEVWLWKHNPAGLFATFNPRVHCPPA
jgi:hypothetical protein